MKTSALKYDDSWLKNDGPYGGGNFKLNRTTSIANEACRFDHRVYVFDQCIYVRTLTKTVMISNTTSSKKWYKGTRNDTNFAKNLP